MKLWLVGRIPDDPMLQWELIGVYDTYDQALAVYTSPQATDNGYMFIAPIMLNGEPLPQEDIDDTERMLIAYAKIAMYPRTIHDLQVG